MKVTTLLVLCFACTSAAWAEDRPVFDLGQAEVIDLTHTFSETTPRWGGFPAMKRTTLYHYERDGFWGEIFTHVGQYGTHLDPPAHFHKGLRTIEAIPAEELVLPLVVIDVSGKVRKNPDYELSLQDIEAWEKEFGPIPAGSFVVNRTDWSKRWPDSEKLFNRDKKAQSHTPGWDLEALQFLFENRKVTGIGHETMDTDAGFRNSLDRERYVLSQNRYQVELLANVDQLPAKGAVIIIGVPKVGRGSGFPARVLALVPREASKEAIHA